MKGFVLSCACFLISLAVASCQYALPYDPSTGNDFTLEKLLDPFSMQGLKFKFPKKYSPKLTCPRDLALEAKYKLAGKLLARQLKNLNGNNYNLQNQMYGYGQMQPLMVQPVMIPGAHAAAAQQQQQQQLAALQYQLAADPIKAASFPAAVEAAQAAFPRMADVRYQQAALMPQGSLSVSTLHPQQTTVLHTPLPVHVQRTA